LQCKGSGAPTPSILFLLIKKYLKIPSHIRSIYANAMPNTTLEFHVPLWLGLTSRQRNYYSISSAIFSRIGYRVQQCYFISLYVFIFTQKTSWSIFPVDKTSLNNNINMSFKAKSSYKTHILVMSIARGIYLLNYFFQFVWVSEHIQLWFYPTSGHPRR
jgi:hypothetical protein